MYLRKHVPNSIINVPRQRLSELTAGIVEMVKVNLIIAKLTNITLASDMGNTAETTCTIVFIFEKLILVCDNWQSVYAKFYCDAHEK